MRQLFRELKRRNIYKVAATYAVVAFIVWQAASLLFPALGFPRWTVDFVIVLTLFGFPIALVIAWAFELTPEGVRRTPEDEAEPGGGSAVWWVGLVVVVALAGGVWYATTAGGADPSGGTAAAADSVSAKGAAAPRLGERSIAVLPFHNLSGTEEAQPFVNGIHDDLLTRLSNVAELKVISRTSVLPYRETELSVRSIADTLGVRWVLEGGVQAAGDRVQVNAQLIDARADVHEWAESYERELTTENIFAVQSDLTRRIVRSLEAELTPEEANRVERRPTEDLDAYRLYVQGRTQLDTRTPEGVRRAVDFFQGAIDRDSSYALAWAGLADAIGLHPLYGTDSLPTSLPEHEEAARRALELAPDLAEGHAAMGFAHFQQRNGPAALRELERGVELKPSYAQAHQWLATVQVHLGRQEAAADHLMLVADLNPRLLEGLLAAGRSPNAPTYLLLPRTVELYKEGAWDELERFVHGKRSEGGDPGSFGPFYLARIAALRGDTASARAWLARIRQEEASDRRHLVEGLVHAALGEEDAAFAAWKNIDELATPPERTLLFRYWYDDILDPLRDDPRYRELIGEINRQWGLNPDGSLPDSVAVPVGPQADG